MFYLYSQPTKKESTGGWWFPFTKGYQFGTLMVSLLIVWTPLNKQLSCWWYKTPWWSRDMAVMTHPNVVVTPAMTSWSSWYQETDGNGSPSTRQVSLNRSPFTTDVGMGGSISRGAAGNRNRASHKIYSQISNISGTKSQNLNVSRLVLWLSLPNPLKPGVKLRMKM